MSPAHVGARFPEGWRALVPAPWLEGWAPEALGLEGGATEVVAMGQGPPLLLLPPLPGYKEAYLALARLLARRFRVVTFDLRERFPGPPSWAALEADLECVAAVHAPEAAVVMGHSLGAALAMRWALAHPERVRALVLSSPFAHVAAPGGHAWKRYVEQPLVLAALRWLPHALARPLAARWVRSGAWVLDPRCEGAVVELVRHGIRHLPLALARQCVRLAFAHDLRDRVGAITAPTLLVVGERETAWARAAEAEMATLLPRAERRVSPGAAHLHPLSAPEWLAETTLDWLELLRGAAPTRR